MIKSLLHAFGFTALVVVAIILLIATLYVTMWFVAGIAIVLLFVSIFKMLQIKKDIS